MRHLTGALALIISISIAQPAHAFFGWGKKSAAPAPIGAVIVDMSGKVEFKTQKSTSWSPARPQQPLNEGDTLKTNSNGRAVILFTDGSKIRISKRANFVMEKQTSRDVKLSITMGKLEAWVKKMRRRRWSVRTPTAVAAIRGTEFTVGVSRTGETTWDLFGGSLDISDNFGNSIPLSAGQRLVADVSKGIAEAKPQPIPPSVKMAPEPKFATPKPKAPAPKGEEKTDDPVAVEEAGEEQPLKPIENPAQDEGIEDEEGIPDDISPSAPQ